MTHFKNNPPSDSAQFRQALYDGEIFLVAKTNNSAELTNLVAQAISDIFKIDKKLITDPAQYSDPTQIYAQTQSVRDALKTNPQWQQAVYQVIQDLNLSSSTLRVDYPRLRISLPAAYYQDSMQTAYSLHRDTWYANPEQQINVWLPLQDIEPGQSFNFFPDYFQQPIANNSANFDYQQWKQNVGWQSSKKVSRSQYPEANITKVKTKGLPFKAQQSEILVFSAQHLHQTILNQTNRIRFSLDFRIVEGGDQVSLHGPGNVDNQSKGDTSQDYQY